MRKRSAPKDWELSGWLDVHGRAPAHMTGDLFVPAELRIEEDRLVYAMQTRTGVPRRVAPGRDVLKPFLEIAGDHDGRRILAFASRFGPLGVTANDVAWTIDLHGEERRMPGARKEWHPENELWEPLSTWRRLSAESAGFLRCAEKLRYPADEDPLGLGEFAFLGEGVARDFLGLDLQAQRNLFSVLLSAWTLKAGVGLLVRPCADGFELGLRLEGALSAIGAQLMIAIASPIAFCHNCSKLLKLTRQPVRGKRTWCSDCHHARGAQAQRDAYQRRKSVLVMLSKHVPLETIVRRTGSRTSTVQRIAKQHGLKVRTTSTK